MTALAIVGTPTAVLTSLRAGASTPSRSDSPSLLRLLLNGRELARVDARRFMRDGELDPAGLVRAVRTALPPVLTLRQADGRVTFQIDRSETARRAVAQAEAGGDVAVARRPFASYIPAPATRQALRNNCETASLSILLTTTGARVPQLVLQRKVRKSGPLDPVFRDGHRVWGDPEEGFVGRAEGGGAAGGFGVYETPILELGRTYRPEVQDLSRHPARELYAALLRGHAVMVWIGLSDGPYREWTGPSGGHIRVNLGEHAVVLNGVHGDGDLRVVNPLGGTRERWTRGQFEAMWRRLGRRAIAT